MTFWLLVVSVTAVLGSCETRQGTGDPLGHGPVVRVQLFNDRTTSFELSFDGPVRLLALPELDLIWEAIDGGRFRVELVGESLRVDGEETPGSVRFAPVRRGSFAVHRPGDGGKERRFRGIIDLLPHPGGLRLVNELGIEEYIAGVVGREMEARRFTTEALKAQAIAARTFTLYHLRVGGPMRLSESFPATSRFQAYGGMSYEKPDVLRAVRETAGRVLTYDGKLFQSYYHSSCGGWTASGRVFNERDLPPLQGRQCDYCEGAPGSEWSCEVPLWKVERALGSWGAQKGLTLNGIVDLEPVAEKDSTRPLYIRVRHGGGAFEVRADRFRSLVQEAHGGLGSAVFDVAIRTRDDNRTVAQFTGRGFGHGVGLCQNGANTLAEELDHKGILSFYFPRSSLMRLY